MKEKTTCPICNSSRTKEVVHLKNEKKVFACKNCGNAFTYPKPQIPDYENMDHHASDRINEKCELKYITDLYQEIQVSYKIQNKIIRKYLQKNSSILEIGGGEGIFLDTLKNDYQVELAEPSKSAAQRASIRGIKVYNDYYQNLYLDNTYDLICMSHVLEHIDNPIETVNSLKKNIRNEGYILLTQTNYKGFMPLFLKENWYAWVPEHHFWHFSIEGMKYLANITGLKIIDYKYSRLYHGKSIYHEAMKFFPSLRDQFHILLKKK